MCSTMGSMAEVYRLPRDRTRHAGVYFNRSELNQLLTLYSRHVIRGEWRDYAIDHRAGEAVFSVFRHAADRPIFAISKTLPHGSGSGRDPGRERGIFVVSRGPETLTRSEDIGEALAVFERGPRLIPTAGAF